MRLLEKRRAVVRRTAATVYRRRSDCAQAYLRAIAGTSLAEQVELFAEVLLNHGVRKRRLPPAPDSVGRPLSEEEWRSTVRRVEKVVGSWVSEVQRANHPLPDTARWLWDRLTLFEGSDRVVALALLLDSSVVPYSQIPEGLTLLGPPDLYDEARDRVLHHLAVLQRIFREARSGEEFCGALAVLLESCAGRLERAVLLEEAVRLASSATAGWIALLFPASLRQRLFQLWRAVGEEAGAYEEEEDEDEDEEAGGERE